MTAAASPGMIDARVSALQELLHKGEAAEALEKAQVMLGEAAGRDPAFGMLEYLGGRAAFETGNMAEANRLLLSARQKMPESSDVPCLHGQVLLASDQHVMAVASFVLALVRNPDNATARQLLDNLSEKYPLLKYQRDIEQARLSHWRNFPASIHLETFTRCNARCSFCPSPTLERKGTRMSLELFDRIMQDLAAFPRGVHPSVSMMKVNEPLLDKRLPELLEKARQYIPDNKLIITTNLSALTEKMADRLIGDHLLDEIWVSLNCDNKEAYEELMGLPWERTLKNMDLLAERVAKADRKPRLFVSRVGNDPDRTRRFSQWARDRFPAYNPSRNSEGNWIGQVEGNGKAPPPIGCSRWFEFSVMATGKVALCCMDGKGEWPIGDLNENHVLEIYNSPSCLALRTTALTRLQVNPCKHCSFS